VIFGWFNRHRDRPASRVEPMLTVAVPDRVYKVGDVIAGDFQVRRVMEGGLGTVYLVEHHEGGRCVLKVPKGQSDSAVRESFRNEAETWVRLGNHPNIVTAIGVDEFAGQLFIVAELIEGDELGRVSLRDYLQSGPLRPATIAAWTADFCYGLDHARQKGMVAHRDVKPENLLIEASGSLRITDFGIAKGMQWLPPGEVARQSSLNVWQTQSGKIAGTPPYMSPEQWLAAPQDIRADLYAFGVVLYEMCYGHLPFVGPDLKNIAAQHLHEAPHIPGNLFASIIARCLAKHPESRYAQPLDLLGDISRICREQHVPLPPKPSERPRTAKELEALAMSLGVLGKQDEAIAATQKLVALEPELAANWTQLGRLLTEKGDNLAASNALQRSLSLDATRSSAWNNLGVVLRRQKQWASALQALDRALECDPFNTGAMLNATEPLQQLGRATDAIARLMRAAELAPDKFEIWNNLGAVYIDVGDKKPALACLQKARTLAPQRYHPQIDSALSFARALGEQ
jgi:serine/threonine protein kinase